MNNKMVYLDHAATTAVRPEVVEAMLPYFTERYGNASSIYSLGREAGQAIDEARSHPGPAFIEFQVAREGDDGNVYPMVPAGAALHEMIRRPAPVVEA